MNESKIKMTDIERHRSLCDFLHDLFVRKNHDYGDSFSETYKTLGIVSAATRITDKYNRFINLINGSRSQLVSGETIRDTLIDMANYCLMTVIELDRRNNGESEDFDD